MTGAMIVLMGVIFALTAYVSAAATSAMSRSLVGWMAVGAVLGMATQFARKTDRDSSSERAWRMGLFAFCIPLVVGAGLAYSYGKQLAPYGVADVELAGEQLVEGLKLAALDGSLIWDFPLILGYVGALVCSVRLLQIYLGPCRPFWNGRLRALWPAVFAAGAFDVVEDVFLLQRNWSAAPPFAALKFGVLLLVGVAGAVGVVAVVVQAVIAQSTERPMKVESSEV